jgi:23S rRNA pseudouridine2605 synthase
MPPSTPAVLQRIAKLLARAGIASRREIERMIADGRVAIDGKLVDTPATLLASLRGVTVDGNPVAAAEPARLFAYHKPTGLLVTERDPKGRLTIYDRLPKDLPRLVPVGRLDLNTEGLLLLTTDGELKRQLELPATGVERTYRARTYGPVSQAQLEELIHGIEIEGVRYGAIDANLERRTGTNAWIELTLKEGKNREVRRVLEHLGLKVSRLIRTRYGPIVLGEMAVGEVGEIRQNDLVNFRKQLKLPEAQRRTDDRVEARAKPKPAPVAAPALAKEPERPSARRGKPKPPPRKPRDETAPASKRAERARSFRNANPPRARLGEGDQPQAGGGETSQGRRSRNAPARPPSASRERAKPGDRPARPPAPGRPRRPNSRPPRTRK